MHKFHACFLDRECRMYGAPWRFSWHTNKAYVQIAIRPSDGFVPNLNDERDHYPVWSWRRWVYIRRKDA